MPTNHPNQSRLGKFFVLSLEMTYNCPIKMLLYVCVCACVCDFSASVWNGERDPLAHFPLGGLFLSKFVYDKGKICGNWGEVERAASSRRSWTVLVSCLQWEGGGGRKVLGSKYISNNFALFLLRLILFFFRLIFEDHRATCCKPYYT